MSLVFLHPEIRLHKDEYFWQKNIYTNHLTSLFPLFPPSALCLYFSFLSLPHIFTECPLETSSYKTFPGKPSVTFSFYIVSFSLVAQIVKRLPAMWENRVQSLGWEDPLEKAMAFHSSTLAWKIPWTEEPGRLQSMGS